MRWKNIFRRAEVERANEPEALVVIALFSYCHAKDSSTVLVGQVATWINACRRNIGEEADLKPRAVGAILKSLGFTTDKVDSFGRGLRLTVEVKRKIHQLMQSYTLSPFQPTTIGMNVTRRLNRLVYQSSDLGSRLSLRGNYDLTVCADSS